MTTDNVLLSIADQKKLLVSNKISAQELTQEYLSRIDQIDPQLGSYLAVDSENALLQAKAADAKRSSSQDALPLLGIPLALKDILVTKNLETTAASKILKGWIPPYDGTCVDRLKKAGATILGKLNCDEFAMGSSNENSAYKICRNPWDKGCVPGGSSGGSAAAVAAGLCAGTLGTDTGGSIRQPAAFCGIVGVKPTYGRVSRYGVIAFASSLDQVGPMARTVEDAALLLQTIAGHDPKDATSLSAPVPNYLEALGGDIKGLRIGLPKEYFVEQTDPRVAKVIDQALDTLRSLGATTKEISLPHTKYALATYYLVAPSEASSNLARYDGIRFGRREQERGDSLLDVYRKTRGAGFGDEVKRRVMLGTFALRSGYYDAYYKKAQQVRKLIKNDFDRVFQEVDIIASPTTPTPAFRFGEKTDPVDMYLADIFTLSCNLSGICGISVPAGFVDDTLPVGIQFLGKPLDEATLFRAGHCLEKEIAITNKHPALPFPGGVS